jgi:hypothetical protein
MALGGMTVHRYEEIRRRLAEGRSLHEVARAWAVRVARRVKCVTGSASGPMRRSRCRVRFG